MQNLGLPLDPGIEVLYFNVWKHGQVVSEQQLRLSLENGNDDTNLTTSTGKNANQRVHPLKFILCTMEAHSNDLWSHKPYYPRPRDRVISNISDP